MKMWVMFSYEVHVIAAFTMEPTMKQSESRPPWSAENV